MADLREVETTRIIFIFLKGQVHLYTYRVQNDGQILAHLKNTSIAVHI